LWNGSSSVGSKVITSTKINEYFSIDDMHEIREYKTVIKER